MRITYSSDLNLHSISQSHSNPTELFSEFFKQACQCKEIIEPNTMFISTCGENQPSIRPVLLKEVKDNNFIFFTNYESKKSQDMDRNNKVAACFYWEPLQRCVRIEGNNNLTQATLRNYLNLKVSPILHKDLDNPSQEPGLHTNPLKFLQERFYSTLMTSMKKNSKERIYPNLIFGEVGKSYHKKQNSGKEKKAGCTREQNITEKIINGKQGYLVHDIFLILNFANTIIFFYFIKYIKL